MVLLAVAVWAAERPQMGSAAAVAAPQEMGEEEVHYVALTFDDGPSPRCTPQLLDGLQERGAHATFFVVGCQVVKDPDIVERMAEQAAADMEKNEALLRQLLGEGSYWVRPPYGLLSEEEQRMLTVPVINWSVDTEDWKSKDAGKILDIIYRQIDDGDIVLLHDRYLNSVEAALQAIDHLQQQNYRFVTVEELFRIRGITPENGVTYRNIPKA